MSISSALRERQPALSVKQSWLGSGLTVLILSSVGNSVAVWAAAPGVAPKRPATHKLDANVALLASGAKLHKEGKIDEAELIFRQVLAKDPRCVDAFYDLGAVAESRGDLIGALSNYHAALSLRPADRELKEAVRSTEVALHKSGPAAVAIKSGPLTLPGGPLTPDGRKIPQSRVSPDSRLTKDNQLGPEAGIFKDPDIAVETNADGDPVFAISQSDMPPVVVDGKKFQLSSRKGEVVPPTLGITPDQFPDITTSLNTGVGTVCPPTMPVTPPTLSVGQPTHRGRQAAAMLLTIGAGAALSASGLHCPICHMLRFHY